MEQYEVNVEYDGDEGIMGRCMGSEKRLFE